MNWFSANPYLVAIRNELSLHWRHSPESRKKTRTKHLGGQRGSMATVVARPSTPPRALSAVPRCRYDHLFFCVGGAADALYRVRRLCAQLLSRWNLRCAVAEPDHSPAWGCSFSCCALSARHTDFPRRRWPREHPSSPRNCWLHSGVFHGDARRLAATDSLGRGTGPSGLDAKFFYVIPMTDMLIFAIAIGFVFSPFSVPAQIPQRTSV